MELRERAFGTLAGKRVNLKPYETFYITEKNKIKVQNKTTLKPLSLQELVTKLSIGKPTIWIKYLVYRDLRDRGYLVRERQRFDFETFGKGATRRLIYIVYEGGETSLEALSKMSAKANSETLEAKSGHEIRDQIFWFKDKADRELGLRFDLTVGMTRMIANRFDLPEPIKVASIAGTWRYDEPQYGRYRYFTQWDAEVYGVADSSADAEIIAVGTDILESVALKDYVVRLSIRKHIEGIIRSLDIV